MSKKKYVLGIDPGLAKFGMVVVDCDLKLYEFMCIKTTKGKKRLAAEDIFERGQEIASKILEIDKEYDISLVCAESMSYPRSASASAKMASTWGILELYTEEREIPLIMESPQMIKKSLTGSARSSKSDMKDFITDKGYTLPDMNKNAYEHPVDALCAVLSLKESQVFRAVCS